MPPSAKNIRLGRVTASVQGEIAVTRFKPSIRQARKMLSVAVVAGTPSYAPELGAEPLVEGIALDKARCIGNRMRSAAGVLAGWRACRLRDPSR